MALTTLARSSQRDRLAEDCCTEYYAGPVPMTSTTAWYEEARIPCQGAPVATIKRHATGKGNSDKTAMIAAAVNRGWNPTDDNEADALWILDWALNQ